MNIEQLIKDNQRKDLIIQQLKSGIISVRELIDNSDGVCGLHLNGDIATWEELQEGGQFEAWLLDFNYAEDI